MMQLQILFVAGLAGAAHAALVSPPTTSSPARRASSSTHVTLGAPARRAPQMKCVNGVCLLVDDNSVDANAWAPADGVVRRGVCSFWNEKKGYGFVTSANCVHESSSIFVHYSDLMNMGGFRSLHLGDEVEFKLARDPTSGKTKAIDVSRVEQPPISEEELDDLLAFVLEPPGMPVTTSGRGPACRGIDHFHLSF